MKPFSLASVLDRRDERDACRIRDRLGPGGWLLSWHRLEGGGWRARLSCPGLPRTIERTGTSRREAILSARIGAERLILLRGLPGLRSNPRLPD